MKIAVMGYSGAGKSTLAKKLGRLYDCPVLYLDRIQFEPGWKERDREEAKRMAEHSWTRIRTRAGLLTATTQNSARNGVWRKRTSSFSWIIPEESVCGRQ